MSTRREFVRLAGTAAAAAAFPGRIWLPRPPLASFLVQRDEGTADHLKASARALRALERCEEGEWLLNYRSVAYHLPASEAVRRDAALAGITLEPIGPGD